MLFNRALQVSVVKPSKDDTTDTDVVRPYQDPELMNEIAKDFVKHTALTLGAVFVAKTVLTTACEIVKIAAQAKL
jgi:hypothetical protein